MQTDAQHDRHQAYSLRSFRLSQMQTRVIFNKKNVTLALLVQNSGFDGIYGDDYEL